MKEDNPSFQRIKQQADKGDANAQLLLGDMYVEGRFVEKNFDKALSYSELSAKQGNANATVEV